MSITKKPLRKVLNEDYTEAIINKGGSSPVNLEVDRNDNIKITIRLPCKMLNIIDLYLEKSISKKTRTCWLKEAAEEKIEKEIMKSLKTDL